MGDGERGRPDGRMTVSRGDRIAALRDRASFRLQYSWLDLMLYPFGEETLCILPPHPP